MAISLDALQEELEERVLDVWTTVIAIFDVHQIMAMSQERVKREMGAAGPYVVIELGELEESERLLAPECYEMVVKLHYVMKTTTDTKGGHLTMRQKLLTMSRDFDHNDLDNGDVVSVGPIDTSPGNPMNDIFLTKELPYVAGTLSVTIFLADGDA